MNRLCVAIAVLWLGPIVAADADPFEKYAGKEPVPEGLRTVFVAFAKQAARGEDVTSFLLPHSAVTITRDERSEKNRDYGRDINLPFLKSHFSAAVFSIRKDPDDCYLVRTGTTAIWFVETKSGAWKIYSYLDKPIQ